MLAKQDCSVGLETFGGSLLGFKHNVRIENVSFGVELLFDERGLPVGLLLKRLAVRMGLR